MSLKELCFKFRDELKKIYYKYPVFINVLNDEDDEYIEFLYLHLNENICLKITDNFNGKYLKKIEINPKYNYCKSLLKIYDRQLNNDEKEILNSNNKFSVYFYYKKYPYVDQERDNKYFYYKNRRDFLVPCFLNNNTIKFLELVNIDNYEEYKNNNKLFFITLANIRKYVKTTERLGTMVDGSATLSIHNVRKMKDLDLVIYHPRYYDPKVRYNLINMHKQLKFIDPYFHNFLSWKGEEKYVLDKQVSYITNNKIKDFNYVVFEPEFTYYFFGIKIISLDYNLKYRAMRNYPKNIADIIITKYKLNIDVPKIKKLEDKINANDERIYDKKDFIDTILKYLKKFNFKINNFDINIDEELEKLSK
jgi:hypothetical protein